jgi:hypothetical protein
MKSVNLGLIGALAVAGAAYGQQPPDVVNSDAYGNTAMGTNALILFAAGDPPNGSSNTAVGAGALQNYKIPGFGSNNTAIGRAALSNYDTGNNNTVAGMNALAGFRSGGNNTASGMNAMVQSNGGNNNTASGYNALYGAPYTAEGEGGGTGSNNTGMGVGALYSYSTGGDNTASGYEALYSNTTGNLNVAVGFQALHSITATSDNAAFGSQALYSNVTGSDNTALGHKALLHATSGSNNIAVGWFAGQSLTTGSNNIEIGSQGAAADHNTIRIGTQGTQAATFIAGIYNHSLTGSEVVISSTGELGVHASSERFKTAIAPMATNSAKLQQLRPVTFHLKTDPKGALQYGLIAEEVAKIYPELVIRDESGRIDGVRYDELAPMLLNEMQKQQKAATAQAAEISALKQQLAVMQAAVVKLQAKDELVAQR